MGSTDPDTMPVVDLSIGAGGAGSLGPAVAPDEVLTPATVVARFVVHRTLGAGGTGVVYAAHDPHLDRTIALKVLRRELAEHADARARFLREAQALARLSHPNVISVYDVGAADGYAFIAMEYIHGRTFGEWVAAADPSWSEVVAVLIKAGRGLSAAHAAGLIHRDFKPANLLVGDDGRVVVTDFGLARTEMASPPDASAADAADAGEPAGPPQMRSSALAAALTRTGAVQGTPAYMAPEQHQGRAADSRADQFSFCVTLYEAVFRMHPFLSHPTSPPTAPWSGALGSSVGRAAVSEGGARIPRDSRGAPAWLLRTLLRGLSLRPDDRFPSMDSLLAALHRELAPPDRRLRWVIGAGAAIVIGLVAVIWQRSRSQHIDQRCTGSEAAYASTWNPERRAAVEAAFTASGAPYAASALARVVSALGEHASRWVQAHTATCRATRILGEQTESMLELRMTCLERRRQEAAALIATLASADAAVVTRSVDAVLRLPDVAACTNIAGLQQIAAPPADNAMRVKLAALTLRLADARALLDTGAFAAGLRVAREIAADARVLGYRPLVAEAAFLQGMLEWELGDNADAVASLEAAVWSAEAGHHDEIAARAWTHLVFIIGSDNAEYARGLALAPRATAALARLGGDPEIEVRLENALGAIDLGQSKLDDAIVHFEKAVAVAERVFGAEHPMTARALDQLGSAMMRKGDAERAVALLQRAFAIAERVFGRDHPSVARELNLLGDAHALAGDPALGERELRRALAIREAALGASHPDVVTTLSELADTVRLQGRAEEALALDRRQIGLAEHVFGPDHPMFARLLMAFASSLIQAGRHAEAREPLRRAETIFTRLWGTEHDMVTLVHVMFGDLLIAESRWRDAVAVFERVLPAVERAQEASDAREDVRVSLALAQVELHQPVRAIAALEPLMPGVDKLMPGWRGGARFVLARALWDSGRDRKRARQLASLARGDLVSAGRTAEVAKLDRWLSAHRAP